MTDVRIGLRMEMGLPTYDALSKQAKLAESLGYDALWLRDHVSLESTTGQAECLECWTAMSALARDTSTIQIGSLVLCTPFRNPALLAKMSATLDLLSGGRLILGLGAGHKASEFAEYGYPFPSPRDRLTMLDEAIQIIRRMWTERRPSFAGEFFQINEALNEPKPVRIPPILIGADGPRALRIVARLADAWNTVGSVATYTNRRATLERHCDEVNRDPASIRHYVSVNVIVDPTEQGARRRLETMLQERPGQQYLAERITTGTPDQVAEAIRPLIALGAHDFIVHFWELNGQEEGIEAFARDVLPLLS